MFRRARFIRKGVITIIIYSILFFVILKLGEGIQESAPKDKKIYDSVFTFCEYSFFTTFFLLNIQNARFKNLMWGLSVGFVIFQIVYFFTAQKAILDSVPIGIETILLFIYIIYFLFEQFKNQKNLYIYSHPGFWISIGIMIYLGGTFFFNILVNHMEPVEVQKYWYFTFIADILKNIAFAIAISVYLKKPKQTPFNHSTSVPYLDMV